MLNIIFTSTKDAMKDHGCAWAVALFIILLGVAFGLDCLIVWACMALWNACLVPLLANTALAIGAIRFWPMFGIYLLFGFLFRSHSTSSTNNN